MQSIESIPVLIEAAISPFSMDAPAQGASEIAADALACIAAGASIIHHHHSFRLSEADAIEEMTSVGKTVLGEAPGAILYPDFLRGRTSAEKFAHFEPMHRADTLGMIPVDPGASVPYGLDADGIPEGPGYVWNTLEWSAELLGIAERLDVPMTIGVYEPVQLRWALACEAAGRLPAGTMIKLYFGGRYSLFEQGKPALNFGLPPTPEALDAYLSMLEGSPFTWNVGLMGDVLLEFPLARYALERGGHLRVGIEDTAGLTDATNVETVEAAVALANEVGRPIARGADARAVLGRVRE